MALVGLLVLWPVLIVVAILIRVKMPGGPVIFKQKRVGLHGNLFTVYKFRSMTVSHGGSSVSVAGESRITPLGAKLRKYKLDELPELWNVLISDMSFVGPRPDVPGYADKLKGEDRLVLELRPGITGLATLKYRDEENLIADFLHQVKELKSEKVKEFIATEAKLYKEHRDGHCLTLYLFNFFTFASGELVFIVTSLYLDLLVVEHLFPELWLLAFAHVLPATNIHEVGVVALGLAFLGLVLLTEVATARLLTMEGVACHELTDLDEVEQADSLVELYVERVHLTWYVNLLPEGLAQSLELLETLF